MSSLFSMDLNLEFLSLCPFYVREGPVALIKREKVTSIDIKSIAKEILIGV
jgi:hypothetical protein